MTQRIRGHVAGHVRSFGRIAAVSATIAVVALPAAQAQDGSEIALDSLSGCIIDAQTELVTPEDGAPTVSVTLTFDLASCEGGDAAAGEETAAAEEAAGGGWFTEAQVARGEGLYNSICAACHGTDVYDAWSGFDGSAQELVDIIISLGMPANNPGGLPAQDYIDIAGYIMHGGGMEFGPEVIAGTPATQEARRP